MYWNKEDRAVAAGTQNSFSSIPDQHCMSHLVLFVAGWITGGAFPWIYLHLGLLHVGIDHSCHVAESCLPGVPVQQDAVQDLEQLLLQLQTNTSQHHTPAFCFCIFMFYKIHKTQ